MSVYIVYTWTITGILFPFVSALGLYIADPASNDAGWILIFYILGGFFISILWFTICGIISGFFIAKALAIDADVFGKFLLWFFICALVIVVNGGILGLLFQVPFEDLSWLLWYNIASVWITLIIRYNYFVKLNDQNIE
jgi:hypothetical protein